MNLIEQWDALLDGVLPDGLSRRRLPSDPDTDVFIGVRSPERHPVLMIGLDKAGADKFRRFDAEALKANLETIREGQQVVCVELAVFRS